MTGRADLPVSRGGGEAAQQRRPTKRPSLHPQNRRERQRRRPEGG
jgi:hypothetical protein